MESQPPSGPRLQKFVSLFYGFTNGKRLVDSPHGAKQFFNSCEAYCSEKGPVKCVEILVSSAAGMKAMESSVRISLDAAFIATNTVPFIKRFSEPGLESLNNGIFLRQILLAILFPKTFWDALLTSFYGNQLDGSASEVFAWICLQIVSIRDTKLDAHKEDVKIMMEKDSLLQSQFNGVRKIAYRIKKMIKVFAPRCVGVGTLTQPGGRHDNDFEDFRKISIYPTTDELESSQEPFLQRVDDVFQVPMEDRARVYRDWLYRLLREDLLAELREDLQTAMNQKHGRQKLRPLGDFKQVIMDDEDAISAEAFTLYVECGIGPVFPKSATTAKARKAHLEKQNISPFTPSIGALCCDNGIVAFGSLVQSVALLSRTPPVVGMMFRNPEELSKALGALQGQKRNLLKFIVVNTPMFAYEPILQRLKDIGDFPLEEHIINPSQRVDGYEAPPKLALQIQKLISAHVEGNEVVINKTICSNNIRLQGAQLESLINGLKEEVAQIQGPPGTGKSFLGALIIRILMRLTEYRVLVLSYTNHALDQFLEELMDIGVCVSDIVRLGSKATAATEETLLKHLAKKGTSRLTFEEKTIIDAKKQQASQTKDELQAVGLKLSKDWFQPDEILEWLEFSEKYSCFWEGFQIPQSNDGFEFVGAKNKTLKPEDLFQHWANCRANEHLEALTHSVHVPFGSIYLGCSIPNFVRLSTSLNELKSEIKSIFDQRDRRILNERRIIASTTTEAAKYQSIIKTADPHVIIVEEAGEILEAHVVTAMSPSVKQLILIGDHKQLRPKINNFKLSKEKGEGYDLNVSLFERLILQGHHFTTLQEQHRSHPDISHFARILAYPELKDVPKTRERERIRGLRSRISFVNHECQEEQMDGGGERWDPTSKSSKRNQHEAKMVLKLVRYLGQQGYKSDNMVVLTPYLGQLFLLKEILRTENDPYLNDLDSHDLVRAGLMSEAEAKVEKKSLRLSTIDNYQGEERDIVIVSLTRNNASGDIGFLYARERLVVLMSRAREGMVLFGNMATFMKSKRGGSMWKDYFTVMKEKNYLFDSVPVTCQRHPENSLELKIPQDFDEYCPDGGCAKLCGAPLSCGQHFCKLHCHYEGNHSRIRCEELIKHACQHGHERQVECGNAKSACPECVREDNATRRRIKRDLELEKKRLENRERYKKHLEEIEDEIAHEKLILTADSEAKQQAESLKKKQDELKSLQKNVERKEKAKLQKQQREVTQPPAPPTGTESSQAKADWDAMKKMDGSCNDAIESLMGMIGLESIKRRFLSIKSSVDTKIRQGVSPENERYSCSLLGNPGTGKTTIARVWGKFLATVGAISGNAFEETTGSKLANKGVSGCEKLIDGIKNNGGGVLFIDEAYQLSSGSNPGGAAVMDYLLAEVENLRGQVVFVLAGYSKQMESFFQHNPGFPSRFPIEMKFEDYTDDELLSIIRRQINLKFAGRMKIEGGEAGLYFRIASRRIGYSRGKEGFGNARAVENFVQGILERQAERLHKARLADTLPDDLLLTSEDIIGPEPSSALTKSKAHQRLTQLIGLKEVKDSLKALMDTVRINYERELAEEPLVSFSLNRVFLGNPGTGKTTVAKLFAQVLVDIGLLSNGEVVVKCPSDFVGAHLGQSEEKTKGILASTIGKVLVIDEAYGLYSDGLADPYKTAVIDTIVNEVQSVPGEDRCVLMLGYKDDMEKMFQNVNPGLSRRFPLSSAFMFEDFSDDDLSKILEFKLKGCGFNATARAKLVALEVLRRARNRPHFGNAGEVEILLGRAKESQQKRVSAGKAKRKNTFEACDFDPDFDRSETGTDIRKLFGDEIGRGRLIALLEGYQKRVRDAKALDMDPEIPFNFLFRGPPGTGKTTTARKMGKVYYDMGFLSSTQVIECSATDLIGSYVGQTGPKVQNLLDKALGRILFIDEAYRLCDGTFAKEAIDEIIDCVTKPKYNRKLIIIMAGYEKDINSLLSINPGMSSRFPETVEFHSFDPGSCIKLMRDTLKQKKKKLESKGKQFDMDCLESPNLHFMTQLQQKLLALSKQDGWANARDVIELANMAFRGLDLQLDMITLSEDAINEVIDRMSKERMGRMVNKKESCLPSSVMNAFQNPHRPNAEPTIQTSMSTDTKKDQDEEKDSAEDSGGAAPLADCDSIRDVGVSDAVWEQLQKDKKKQDQEEAQYHQLLEKQKNACEADRERILKEVIAEEERRKKEAAQLAKLQKSGLCPAGFVWIKQDGGYRCAGGAHCISGSDLEKM